MIEKEELRSLKKTVTAELRDIDVLSYNLKKTDDRLNLYFFAVINNPLSHNLYEQLSVLRFFRFLYDYDFRGVEVKKFIVFYEMLKFTGNRGLTRYKLTNVQVFQFASIYGFYKGDTRLTRSALLFVPRKFSKTTSVAAIALYDLLFGDNNAQAFVAANSYDQAKICFDVIRDILKAHDRNLKYFKVNREAIYSLRRGRSSFARSLASNPKKLDGLNASTVILDEYSQAVSAELKNVLTSSMGVRVNPLTIIITTASENINGPFFELLNSYKGILRGELENDSIFAHVFEPDIDDEESDPHTWAKVQPHMGITVQHSFYEEEYKNALLTSQDMMTFRTKLLNLFVQNSAKQWFSQDEISALARDIDIENLAYRYECMVSVDLSVCDDFSAVTYTIHNPDTHTFHSHNDFYLPSKTLETHPNRELYKRWKRDGHLNVLPGPIIDYRAIVNDILARNEKVKILAIGYDAYKAKEFVNILSASGAKDVIQTVSQTYGTFTSPVESLVIAVKTQKITFNNNPIVWYCFGNATLDEDRMGNKKPIKRSANGKIDGAITNLMNFHLFNNYKR